MLYNIYIVDDLVCILNMYLFSIHVSTLYLPTDDDIAKIMQDTGINEKQVKCWFSNNRKRYWKVEMEKLGKHDIVENVMSGTLPPQTVAYLKAWVLSPAHFENPFPTEEEKTDIIAATGIEKKQLSCWFSNNRKRFWKPRMDAFRAQHGLSENDPIPAELLQQVDTPSAPETFHRASAAAVEPASNLQQLDDFAILAAAGEALSSDSNKRQKTDEFVAV